MVTLYVFDLEDAAEPTFDQLEVLRENTAQFLFLSIQEVLASTRTESVELLRVDLENRLTEYGEGITQAVEPRFDMYVEWGAKAGRFTQSGFAIAY